MRTDFIFGMDISTLEETEAQGGRFYDNGQEGDMLQILKKYGVSSVRLRLWVHPFSENGSPYGAGTCDLKTVISIARRAKNLGMSFMLDLHYSDFWCDPARQLMPKGWENFNITQMAEVLYFYTADVLKECNKNGVSPEYVQVGNEITNGMLWPLAKIVRDENGKGISGFDELAMLLNAGARAVRENSSARVILHLEQSGKNALWRDWFDNIEKRQVDYDIIGASYYPAWHGEMEGMQNNLSDMAARYGKDIMIVETGYPFTTGHFDEGSGKALVIGEDFKGGEGCALSYPLTKQGQSDYLKAILKCADKINRCKGLYFWEPGWLPTKGSTWATGEALVYMNEEYKGTGNEWANQGLFDYDGQSNPALEVFTNLC